MPEERPARKRYVTPHVTRVDFVEDEIALASCKTPKPQVTTQGSNPNSCAAKNCRNNGTS